MNTNRLVFIALAFLVSLTACGDTEDPEQDDNDELTEEPCIAVEPETLDFEEIDVGETATLSATVENCSAQEPLQVHDVAVAESDDDVFAIVDESLPDDWSDSGMELDTEDAFDVDVEYGPGHAGEHQGELTVESDVEGDTELAVELLGEAVGDEACLMANAEAYQERDDREQGEEGDGSTEVDIEPGHIVWLSADGSEQPSQGELEYQWELSELPEDSESEFMVDDAEEVNLLVDAPGEYLVELTTSDGDAQSSCEPAEVVIDVELDTDHDIEVRQSWQTMEVEQEGGPSVGDERGVDVESHYMRGGDSWGEMDTVYWPDMVQDWDEEGTAEMIRDERFGKLPEVVGHDDPKAGEAYRFGSHYFCENGWGAARTTVQVYIEGELNLLEVHEHETTGSFWEVVQIEWDDEEPTVEFVDDSESSGTLGTC